MSMKPIAALGLLAVLAACGTPQEQCIARNTRDLRTVNHLVAESQENLRRGYALVETTIMVPEWQDCEVYVDDAGKEHVKQCIQHVPKTTTKPMAIDLNVERDKLESLMAKRDQLEREAQSVVAQCRAQYPE